ncbi:peptidyl-prolyl cis-trans isomerase [Sulfolobus acidocaldarius DSM 639]|uniref:Peptidyl-prolyl cis-trans isomerase n=4 Tax=Sulfolobus acidocaldarius TaxID=2285 RepID=Q4JB00_SULAC|nr:peptidyl-prolyl cis-trans isomerase [Sulfolobus acidocaldarius DSM 639]
MNFEIQMFKDKDFVYIDYVAKVKDTGEIFDTTIEEEAKKANIYSNNVKYEPKLVILGEHSIISGLEEAIYQMNAGEEKEVEIPPEKAYGKKDPTKVRIVSLGDLKKRGVNPYPNMMVRFTDGSVATVKSVTGGRVVLDFNHPLADKTVIYKVKVVKVLQDEKDKVKAVLEKWLGKNNADKFGIELGEDKKNLKITVPKDYYKVEDFQLVIYMLARDIINYVLPESVVSFIENFQKDTFS